MSDWTIELFDNQINSKSLAEKFSNSFPQRSQIFFERMIELLDSSNSRLLLLFVNGEVKGATFAFRIFGYDCDVWSPSYLYVEKAHRNISLFFIIGALKKISSNIIDVSPTEDVRKILSAVKYKEFSKGSLMFPALLGLIPNSFSDWKLIKCSSPFELFAHRSDLIWFGLNGVNCHFCIKKTSRYGITFFVLVYFNKVILGSYFVELLQRVARINPLGILIVPNLGKKLGLISFCSEKYHSYSNVSNLGDIYSILGSEVTEVL